MSNATPESIAEFIKYATPRLEYLASVEQSAMTKQAGPGGTVIGEIAPWLLAKAKALRASNRITGPLGKLTAPSQHATGSFGRNITSSLPESVLNAVTAPKVALPTGMSTGTLRSNATSSLPDIANLNQRGAAPSMITEKLRKAHASNISAIPVGTTAATSANTRAGGGFALQPAESAQRATRAHLAESAHPAFAKPVPNTVTKANPTGAVTDSAKPIQAPAVSATGSGALATPKTAPTAAQAGAKPIQAPAANATGSGVANPAAEAIDPAMWERLKGNMMRHPLRYTAGGLAAGNMMGGVGGGMLGHGYGVDTGREEGAEAAANYYKQREDAFRQNNSGFMDRLLNVINPDAMFNAN